MCVDRDRASLALEQHPYVSVHLASCLSGMGKLVEALVHAKDAAAAAARDHDEDLERTALARTQELLRRIPHITLALPREWSGATGRFDTTPIGEALFNRRLAVNPGDHSIDVDRDADGKHAAFRGHVTLAEGEERTIAVVLTSS